MGKGLKGGRKGRGKTTFLRLLDENTYDYKSYRVSSACGFWKFSSQYVRLEGNYSKPLLYNRFQPLNGLYGMKQNCKAENEIASI